MRDLTPEERHEVGYCMEPKNILACAAQRSDKSISTPVVSMFVLELDAAIR